MDWIRNLMAAADPLKDEPLTTGEGSTRELVGADMGDVPPHARRVAPVVWGALGGVAALAVVAALVVVPKLSPPPPAADEPYYGSAESLRAAADVVVLGTVEGSEAAKGADQVSTSVSVSTFVGDDPGTEISVNHPSAAAQPGIDLEEGTQYVFVLDETSDGEYVLVNVSQGAVPVDDGTLASPSVLGPEVLAALGVSQP